MPRILPCYDRWTLLKHLVSIKYFFSDVLMLISDIWSNIYECRILNKTPTCSAQFYIQNSLKVSSMKKLHLAIYKVVIRFFPCFCTIQLYGTIHIFSAVTICQLENINTCRSTVGIEGHTNMQLFSTKQFQSNSESILSAWFSSRTNLRTASDWGFSKWINIALIQVY